MDKVWFGCFHLYFFNPHVLILLLRATTLTYGDLLICQLFHPGHDRLHLDRVISIIIAIKLFIFILEIFGWSICHQVHFKRPLAAKPAASKADYSRPRPTIADQGRL